MGLYRGYLEFSQAGFRTQPGGGRLVPWTASVSVKWASVRIPAAGCIEITMRVLEGCNWVTMRIREECTIIRVR